MKKAVYLSSIKIWALWVDIPLVILLIWILYENSRIEGIIRLYPLLLVVVAAIVFTIVYFARLVKVSYEEIRAVGPFSGRDRVIINAGKTIKLVKGRFGKVHLSVIGHEVACSFEWMKPEDRIRDITLFRAIVYGGDLAIKQVLGYYGAEATDLGEILAADDFRRSYDFITVEVGTNEDGEREYTIKMDETI